ncbi:hypothetical protein J27TS8_40620 [Robertmurraya siralis]|uniref:6-hydroxymethylpterin diphosphokinase MptE-like domain-containing protein n=1 Tax=Robertmurraya siralis TaxID=77777 RepID=A0A920BVE9_9BACI|nr:6-hydroxymethylpterin diphosphokinase MptE-like protein [Robertmurraya siralis]GIN64069.1 hypothetical protein J27TS8_40620 [Robertmurraya siralis]
MRWNIISAKNGQKNIEICRSGQRNYIHSSYNPEREADRWTQRYSYIDKNIKKIYVIGMGLGYHIKAFQRKFPHTELEVWDFNNKYKQWLLTNKIVNTMLENNVVYKSSEDLIEINEMLFERIKSTNAEIIIHKPSLSVIPDNLFFLRNKLEDLHYLKDSVLDKQNLLELNFFQNINLRDEGISSQKECFNKASFLLVSAGPSLNKQLQLIKEAQGISNVVIGCVGTALKPLLLENILPDFIMVSDPLDNIFKQIEGIDTKNLMLYYLSTSNHKTVSSFKGKRFIVWQDAYTLAKKEAKARGELMVETGGSVATCLLDLMVKLGGKRIAFVGQDLAFTNNMSHSATSTGFRNVNKNWAKYTVENFEQTGKVETSKNLVLYLHWFENYIARTDHVEFYNCTEGGAYINGCQHIPLKKYLELIND